MNKLIHKIFFFENQWNFHEIIELHIKVWFFNFFFSKNPYNILDALDTSLFAVVVVIVAVVRLLLDAYDH